MSLDPIAIKTRKLDGLQKEEQQRVQELISLTNKVNQVRDKADLVINKMLQAVAEAEKEYMDFLNSLEVIRVQTKKIVQDTF